MLSPQFSKYSPTFCNSFLALRLIVLCWGPCSERYAHGGEDVILGCDGV
jgi:hypothetical protein